MYANLGVFEPQKGGEKELEFISNLLEGNSKKTSFKIRAASPTKSGHYKKGIYIYIYIDNR
jgi:hypothetical protein